jgi:uncharacterized protein DUF3309
LQFRPRRGATVNFRDLGARRRLGRRAGMVLAPTSDRKEGTMYYGYSVGGVILLILLILLLTGRL